MARMIKIISNEWSLLASVAIIYSIAAMANPSLAAQSFWAFIRIFIDALPVIFAVFGIMFLTNIFLKARDVSGLIGKGSVVRGWVLATAVGIVSSGPIYMWYPLLSVLKEMGMKNSLIAVFLYNRAVKIPLLPLMIFYFGWQFVAVLTVLMIVFSVLNGMLVEKLAGR